MKHSTQEEDTPLSGFAETGNPNTTQDLLQKLASDPDEEVRLAVAQHLFTPPAVLQQLAGDSQVEIRHKAAIHPDIPLDALAVLILDCDPDVQQAALKEFHKRR
jgi:hypothetical protein